MSEAQQLQSLRERYDGIADVLARAEQQQERTGHDGLRQEIVSLFQDTERLIEQLTALREGIRPLVDRYRAACRAAPDAAPAAPAEAATVRVDHLGASTFVERGWTGIAMGDYDGAREALTRALSLAPGDTHAEALLSWALARQGRGEEARRLLDGILAREPEHGLARTNLGYICFREGRFAEAIEHLTGVLRTDGNRTATLYANLYLGMLYAEREMYRDATRFFQRALELGPNLSEAYWEMGRAFYREGSRSLALEAWKHGARTNRYNPWGERCAEAADRLAAGEAVSVD